MGLERGLEREVYDVVGRKTKKRNEEYEKIDYQPPQPLPPPEVYSLKCNLSKTGRHRYVQMSESHSLKIL